VRREDIALTFKKSHFQLDPFGKPRRRYKKSKKNREK
jgi:hypothetical protein